MMIENRIHSSKETRACVYFFKRGRIDMSLAVGLPSVICYMLMEHFQLFQKSETFLDRITMLPKVSSSTR